MSRDDQRKKPSKPSEPALESSEEVEEEHTRMQESVGNSVLAAAGSPAAPGTGMVATTREMDDGGGGDPTAPDDEAAPATPDILVQGHFRLGDRGWRPASPPLPIANALVDALPLMQGEELARRHRLLSATPSPPPRASRTSDHLFQPSQFALLHDPMCWGRAVSAHLGLDAIGSLSGEVLRGRAGFLVRPGASVAATAASLAAWGTNALVATPHLGEAGSQAAYIALNIEMQAQSGAIDRRELQLRAQGPFTCRDALPAELEGLEHIPPSESQAHIRQWDALLRTRGPTLWLLGQVPPPQRSSSPEVLKAVRLVLGRRPDEDILALQDALLDLAEALWVDAERLRARIRAGVEVFSRVASLWSRPVAWPALARHLESIDTIISAHQEELSVAARTLRLGRGHVQDVVETMKRVARSLVVRQRATAVHLGRHTGALLPGIAPPTPPARPMTALQEALRDGTPRAALAHLPEAPEDPDEIFARALLVELAATKHAGVNNLQHASQQLRSSGSIRHAILMDMALASRMTWDPKPNFRPLRAILRRQLVRAERFGNASLATWCGLTEAQVASDLGAPQEAERIRAATAVRAHAAGAIGPCSLALNWRPT